MAVRLGSKKMSANYGWNTHKIQKKQINKRFVHYPGQVRKYLDKCDTVR